MHTKMISNMNGYVLSPFGAVDMNDPAYGWGGTGATSTPTAQPASVDFMSVIGNIGSAIGNIFAPKTGANAANAAWQQQQQMMLMQQQQEEERSRANLPLYIGGALAVGLVLFMVLKK